MRRRVFLWLLPSLLMLTSGCGRDRLRPDQHLVDAPNRLSDREQAAVEMLARDILRYQSLDLVVVVQAENRGVSLSDRANELFRRWRLGDRSRGNRGALLLLSLREQEVRLHTSYETESLLTDAFISFIEHEQLKPYFSRGYLGDGITAAMDLIGKRLDESLRGGVYHPSMGEPLPADAERSGGGGVEHQMVMASTPAALAASTAPGSGLARFAAQPTAKEAWERVLEWATTHVSDVNIGVFDEQVRHSWDGRPVTAADQDMMFGRYKGHAYEVREKGDLAAIVYPDDPDHKLAPMFFKRGPEGWQVNGMMYSHHIGLNQASQWRFVRVDHPYQFAFEDFDLDAHGYTYRRRQDHGGYLGATMHNGTPIGRGVLLIRISPGLAGARAGLEAGDIVLRYNGTPVNRWEELLPLIQETVPGTLVQLDVLRGAVPASIDIDMGGGRLSAFHPVHANLNPPQEIHVSATIGRRP